MNNYISTIVIGLNLLSTISMKQVNLILFAYGLFQILAR